MPKADSSPRCPSLQLPRPYGQGDFPIDSINLWPWLSAGPAKSDYTNASPRHELVLGKMAGGALIAAGGWKVLISAALLFVGCFRYMYHSPRLLQWQGSMARFGSTPLVGLRRR